MLIESKITVNDRAYQYKVSISTYRKEWVGNGDTATIPCRPCHDNARIEVQDVQSEFAPHVYNCRVFYYLDKNGKPNRRSCRYVYAGIVEARLQNFIKKLI